MIRWIDRFARPWGGRRNLFRVHLARARRRIGGYRAYRRPDWSHVRRLVFVCKGNICRSPYAEFRARSLGLEAVSCGLEARPGALADPTAVEAARIRGLDLSSACATSIEAIELSVGDLALFMEPRQVRDALARYGHRPAFEASLLGIWASPVTPLIPDPYGRGPFQFDHCFELIDSAVATLAQRLEIEASTTVPPRAPP